MKDVYRDGVPVLDHGYVQLVDYLGDDSSVIEAARMSTGKGFEGWEKDARLLEYLYAHGHMTPFEMCELVIEVQAPIFVVREWFRHRTQSYNEMSGRYIQMPDLHYVPYIDRVQGQGKKNKQGSEGALADAFKLSYIEKVEDEQDQIYASYEAFIESGIAKELARINTPVSRYTRFRAKANLRNWLDFLRQRCAPEAQWEIRQYAEVVRQIVLDLWPRTYALWEEHTFHSVKLSRSEAETLRHYLSGMKAAPVEILKKLGMDVGE